jgi:hypothetical protein
MQWIWAAAGGFAVGFIVACAFVPELGVAAGIATFIIVGTSLPAGEAVE